MVASRIIGLIVDIACIVGCVMLAKQKGRNQVLWGVLGFLFSIIALIIIAVLKPKDVYAGGPYGGPGGPYGGPGGPGPYGGPGPQGETHGGSGGPGGYGPPPGNY